MIEVIFSVNTLYGSIFGEPQVLAVGANLSSDALKFGAPEQDVEWADKCRAKGQPFRRTWTVDQGDGEQAEIFWLVWSPANV